jgi:glycosyltransferase involved in cell wall biosynthesis
MLTVVVPVYNEEKIIEENTERLAVYLDSLDIPYEIIICSNGSSDSTDTLGKKLETEFNSRIRFFSISKRGVGLAFKKMVAESTYENIISIDMDLTTDIRFIGEALDLLKENHIIIGSKKVGSQKRTIFRTLLSGGFILLVRVLLGIAYTDYSIGAKAYKKGVIERWISRIDYGSSYVIELIYYAKKEGYNIKEIPVFCDDQRKSRFNLSHEVLYRFRNLLRLWFNVRLKRAV